MTFDGSTGDNEQDDEQGKQASTPDEAPPVEEVIAESVREAAQRRTKEEEEIFPAYDDEDTRHLNPVTRFLGRQDSESDAGKFTVRIEIPSRTIIKVVVALLIIWLVLQITSIFLVLLLSVIVCLALLPLVRRLENRGMSRGIAVITVFAGLVSIFAGFLWLIVPPLVSQTDTLIENAPTYAEEFDQVIDRYPWAREQVDSYLGRTDEPVQGAETEDSAGLPVDTETVRESATQVISIGAAIVGGLANIFFVVVLALYLLVEGERTWRYFARYMTPTLRYRFHRLGPQLTNVVSGYVIGQAIISSLFGLFTYIVLTVLDVPQPLLLALFSALAVAIPIVGVPVATLAAMAIALSVGWQTSLIVLVTFTVYQQFENYILLPRIYGNTLRVSSLSILVGVLVGNQLLGVLGIILSLPLTASIPVIERVWREQAPEDIEDLEQAEITQEPTPTEIVESGRA